MNTHCSIICGGLKRREVKMPPTPWSLWQISRESTLLNQTNQISHLQQGHRFLFTAIPPLLCFQLSLWSQINIHTIVKATRRGRGGIYVFFLYVTWTRYSQGQQEMGEIYDQQWGWGTEHNKVEKKEMKILWKCLFSTSSFSFFLHSLPSHPPSPFLTLSQPISSCLILIMASKSPLTASSSNLLRLLCTHISTRQQEADSAYKHICFTSAVGVDTSFSECEIC